MTSEVSPGLGQMRIPDILETIADLSNDKVFTPPKLANEILDLLPKEIWSDSTITFLDPAALIAENEILEKVLALDAHKGPVTLFWKDDSEKKF